MKRAYILLPFLALFATGCDDNNIVVVTGKVMHEGQPVASVALNFQPESGRPSWGMTDTNGQFKLIYSTDERTGKNTEGAIIGTHRVTVDFPPMDVHGTVADSHKKIMKKYGKSGTETLMIDVTKKMLPLEIKLD